MKLIAIDPGYERCGVAIMEGGRTTPNVLFSDCLRTPSTLPFHDRLALIGNATKELIEEYSPSALAIERLYFNTNQKTAMMVAEVRGALIYLALERKMHVVEFTPLQIKQAVVGYGRGDKKQLIAMVPKLVHMQDHKKNSRKTLDDEYDAIAIGITALAQSKNIL